MAHALFAARLGVNAARPDWRRAIEQGGTLTGPNPTDRAKCGTAIHLASDEHGLPLGVVVTGANANDGVQTRDLLDALVVRPPEPDRPCPDPDPRDRPRVRCAVERGHAFLSQFGRVARRFDRVGQRYLGWVQLASAVIFIRHEANGFFR